ncbi:hypothetical protein PENTCL1PPCAC_5117, partial [Pristionchus entomophagus]
LRILLSTTYRSAVMRTLMVLFLVLFLFPFSTAIKRYHGSTDGIDECEAEYCTKNINDNIIRRTCDRYHTCKSLALGKDTCTINYGRLICCCKGNYCNPASGPLFILSFSRLPQL